MSAKIVVSAFWLAMGTNDFSSAAELLSEDFTCGLLMGASGVGGLFCILGALIYASRLKQLQHRLAFSLNRRNMKTGSA